MLKIIRKARTKKGFTLTELIIVVAILAVLIAAVAAISYPVQRMVRSTGLMADAINANETIGEYIQGRLAYADTLFIRYGINPATAGADADVTQMVNDLKARLGKSNAGKAGVLIFHYVADAERSGYELYEYQITSTTTNFTAACLDATASPVTLKESGAVFDDAFYGNIQRLIYLPITRPFQNASRGEVFMNFEILSYEGDVNEIHYQADGVTIDDATSTYIKPDTLKGIYGNVCQYLVGLSLPADTEPSRSDLLKGFRGSSVLAGISSLRKGDINTSSFVLQNLDATKIYDPTYFKMTPQPLPLSGLSTGIAAMGTDVMIFYHIPDFS